MNRYDFEVFGQLVKRIRAVDDRDEEEFAIAVGCFAHKNTPDITAQMLRSIENGARPDASFVSALCAYAPRIEGLSNFNLQDLEKFSLRFFSERGQIETHQEEARQRMQQVPCVTTPEFHRAALDVRSFFEFPHPIDFSNPPAIRQVGDVKFRQILDCQPCPRLKGLTREHIEKFLISRNIIDRSYERTVPLKGYENNFRRAVVTYQMALKNMNDPGLVTPRFAERIICELEQLVDHNTLEGHDKLRFQRLVADIRQLGNGKLRSRGAAI